MKDSLPEFSLITAAFKQTRDKWSKISAQNATNLTAGPEIALFVITDGENKILDLKSPACVVSDVMNRVMWHNHVQENGFRGRILSPNKPLSVSECSYPVISVRVDGMWCSALVDTGYSHSIVTET